MCTAYAGKVGDRRLNVGAVLGHIQRRMAVDKAGWLRAQRGYNSAEVEGIIFGFMPEWLTREAARAYSGSDAMDIWLVRHEAFVQGWFWPLWKKFNAEVVFMK